MAEDKEEKKTINENKGETKKETPQKEAPKKETVNKEEKKFEPVKAAETKKTKTTTTAKPKADKQKHKNIAIRVVAVVLVLLVVIGLIYVVLPSPARALQQALRNLKTGNYEKIEEYMDYNELMDASVLSSEDIEKNKLFFEDFSYTVKKITQDGDTATIELETTNKDFKVIVQNALTKWLQKYFSNEEAEIENILLEELQNTDIATITTTQTITVQKQEGKWKIVVDDNLRNAIFPGLNDTLETLTNGSMFSAAE